jgi:PmbA protein
MKEILSQVGEKALDEALQSGAEAEVFLMQAKELEIEVVKGQVETLKQAEEIGLGIRVLKQGRTGFAFSSDLSPVAVKQAVEDAIKISFLAAPDEYQVLPPKAEYPVLNLYDQATVDMSIEEKIEIARSVEHSALSVDRRISIIERAGYADVEYCNLIMNSKGLYAYETGNYCGIYIFLVAEDENDAQNGFSSMSVRKAWDLSPARIGKEAARNAIRALHAKRVGSGHMPVVLDPYVATRFCGIIASMVNAEAVQKGKSLLAGKVGEQVASSCLSIVFIIHAYIVLPVIVQILHFPAVHMGFAYFLTTSKGSFYRGPSLEIFQFGSDKSGSFSGLNMLKINHLVCCSVQFHRYPGFKIID